MPLADLHLPPDLLAAGGGPGTPDPRVLRAMSLPTIGQFDPAFTAIMDDVMALGREVFLTRNARCFAVSGLLIAGLEAVLNALIEDGTRVAVLPGAAAATDIARRCGADLSQPDAADPHQFPAGAQVVVAAAFDPLSGARTNIQPVADASHAHGAVLVLDATLALGASDLRIDDWHVDAACAGVDYGLGGPSGMALVTYSDTIEQRLRARRAPPRTSYLDLLQLQAYWSPERLNHHTAPTNLVYGVREALRIAAEEGLPARWARHHRVGAALAAGLEALGLERSGDLPFSVVSLPDAIVEEETRRRLLVEYGVQVSRVGPRAWRLGLLAAEARLEAVLRVLDALGQVLHGRGPAQTAALEAYAGA